MVDCQIGLLGVELLDWSLMLKVERMCGVDWVLETVEFFSQAFIKTEHARGFIS